MLSLANRERRKSERRDLNERTRSAEQREATVFAWFKSPPSSRASVVSE
ncbi:hypothetical protein HSR121_2910 [Halapricum desulfuricans]|uniref:Uncharacterized protein n=1 Tax=Halapricum desulfuricans TaxID=2841257 RepID=A0A897N4R1_9EURY|nr:hypothetical protein HSR121_2910 [Halapricum desulfuricans]